MVISVHFQEAYLNGKNHQTLKSLWINLIAVMKWTELDEAKLDRMKTQRIQFRYVT